MVTEQTHQIKVAQALLTLAVVAAAVKVGGVALVAPVSSSLNT